VPKQPFGIAAFSITAEQWNESHQKTLELPLIPRILFDKKLSLNAESIRFIVETLPRWVATREEPASAGARSMWEGDSVLKVHFRGKVQVIHQPGLLDGGPYAVQVGLINGEPTIEAQYAPHYNNSFILHWVWSAEGRRFLRLSSNQGQGC
jgi:hypothetical protein